MVNLQARENIAEEKVTKMTSDGSFKFKVNLNKAQLIDVDSRGEVRHI